MSELTNEVLIEELRAEIRRGTETTAAIVHQSIKEHVDLIPHSGISKATAELEIARLSKLVEINAKLVDLIDGPHEPNLRGNLIHHPEKGLLARLTRIEAQTNGGTKKLDPKAWAAILATFAATLYQILFG